MRRGWWALWLSLLLACATGPQRAPATLALSAGSYAQPGGPSSSAPRPKAPLTTARLRALAESKGIGLVGPQVTRNREVGLAFQNTVLRSLDIRPNTAKFNTPNRGGPYAAVIPDGTLQAGRINIATGGITYRPEGAFLKVAGADCLDFAEVKARSCALTLSSSQGQMRGFIEALSRQGAGRRSFLGPQPPRPGLLLVTTADTRVTEEVSWEAARSGVAVFQAVAWEEEGLITVGLFVQRTSFVDVPPQFPMSTVPEALKP